MKHYRKPTLNDLGCMTAVTRKSGADYDFVEFQANAFDPANPGDPPAWWPSNLCWPPGVPTLFC